MAQLPLALALPDHASFATFVAGANGVAVEHVASAARGRADTLWLWGARGVGKTHLLQAACRAASGAERRAMYVSVRAVAPTLLTDLENVDLLAIDDVDAVAGDPLWEQPLFVVLNEFLGRSGALLLTARVPPQQCAWRLRDLASRAAGATVYKLAPLDDAERAEALRRHGAVRGLEIEPSVAEFLVKRAQRDMVALTALLDELDRAALSAQRRLTIPFVRDHLAAVGARDR